MAKKSGKQIDNLAEAMKTLVIVQLALAGVPQLNIRNIVGGDIRHVNSIVKQVKRKGRKDDN